MNGKAIDNVVNESVEADGIAGNALIKFAEPPVAGQEIRYVFFEGDLNVKNYSEVIIQNITADGSSTSYNLTTTPGVQEPASFKTIVKVGNNILEAGYTKRYITTKTTLEYKLEDFLFPPGSINKKEVKLYLNNPRIIQDKWNLVIGNGLVIRLRIHVQQQDGDKLDIFIMTSGEYRFGYIDSNLKLWVNSTNRTF